MLRERRPDRGGGQAPLLPALGGGLALALGGLLGVLLGGWWWLPLALALLSGLAVGVVTVTFALLSRVEAPDPAVAARLEDSALRIPGATCWSASTAASPATA